MKKFRKTKKWGKELKRGFKVRKGRLWEDQKLIKNENEERKEMNEERIERKEVKREIKRLREQWINEKRKKVGLNEKIS